MLQQARSQQGKLANSLGFAGCKPTCPIIISTAHQLRWVTMPHPGNASPHDRSMFHAWRLVAGAAVALLLSACGSEKASELAALRVSAIPDQAPERVLAQHGPVIEQVCSAAGLRCTWVASSTYEDVVAALGAGQIDLAFLGGVTFVLAHANHGSIPLVMRDIDARFVSAIIVKASDTARDLSDLRGKSFAFGARSSTSGHQMPRYFLRTEGFHPERDFASVSYSEGHDATVRMVLDGKVTAGAVNRQILDDAFRKELSAGGRLRVLWESPPYNDYVWVARRDLPAAVRERLINAFLDLDHSKPESRDALLKEGAGGFFPAYPWDFSKLTSVLRELGRL